MPRTTSLQSGRSSVTVPTLPLPDDDGQEFPVRHTKPCGECPYRRRSWPGYTGSNPPEWYVDSALADYTAYGLAPCHTTATGDAPLGTCACAGALVFAKNLGKRPRDPERQAAIDRVAVDCETVFASPHELIGHHRGPTSIATWDEGEL